jgi:hypothetical protein
LSEKWLMRAFEEVRDRVPHRRHITDSEIQELKRLIADGWIQGQIDYHAGARKKHKLLLRHLTLLVYLAFGFTLVFALLDATLPVFGVSPALENVSKGLSIALPALGVSVGAALTINQHHALAERSAQMQSDLLVVKQAVQVATDFRTLRDATIAAMRIIRTRDLNLARSDVVSRHRASIAVRANPPCRGGLARIVHGVGVM